MDYYRILNVNRNAPQEDIKKAYRRLSRKYHPDNAGEEAREKFEQIQAAYTILGNEEKRTVYDQQLAGGEKWKDNEPYKKNGHQVDKQDNNYKDLAAFFTGEYKNSFDNFFGKNIKSNTEQDVAAKSVNTDKLFESYFRCK